MFVSLFKCCYGLVEIIECSGCVRCSLVVVSEGLFDYVVIGYDEYYCFEFWCV